jgi:hypothetical protein
MEEAIFVDKVYANKTDERNWKAEIFFIVNYQKNIAISLLVNKR